MYQPDVHTTVTKSTAEALYHILLRSLCQAQREQLRYRIPRQMAIGNEKRRFGRGIRLSQALEFGNIMLCYDVEGEVARLLSPLAYPVLLILEKGVKHFEILVNLLNTDTEYFTWLYASSVEKHYFYVFA